MSSSNDFSSNCGRKLRKTCLTASQFHTERYKPVLDGKASILHNKGTTVSQDLNLAESCGHTKTRNKKDKPQAANQRACLQKTSRNGHVSSKFHETETSVPQQTTPKCPSKTSHKGRKKKNVQPSEKKAASKACSDRLDNFAHNSFQEQHLRSRKTKGTCYRHSKKTQNLSPSHHKILSSHTKTPFTPKRGRPWSTPLFSSTLNSDLSSKRAKNSSVLGCDQNVKKDSLAKTPSRPQRARGSKNKNAQERPNASPPVKPQRPRVGKEKNLQEQPNASPPVKRSRRRAMSPGESPQQEPSIEKQTPSTPCCETQDLNPKELGLHTSSTLSPHHHKKISSTHTNIPYSPRRGQRQARPLLSSTPNSGLQPRSPKRAKSSSVPRCHQNVKQNSLAKMPPADATPSRPQRPRGRPSGSKNRNAQEQQNAFLPEKPQRPRGRPRGSKNRNAQEQQSAFLPEKSQRPRGRPRGSKNRNAQERQNAFLPEKPQRPRGRPRVSKNRNAQERQNAFLPEKPQRPRGRPRGSKNRNAQEWQNAFLPEKPQRPRGRPRGSKNRNAQERQNAFLPEKPQRPRGSKKRSVQEQPSASTPRKRSRSAMSPGESPQEEPFIKKQALSRPNRKESGDQTMSSDLSIELSLQEESVPVNRSFIMDEEEEDQDDDEEELPSFLQQDNRKPLSISEGHCVWCKLRKNPYWPAVVKSVNHKSKKASVLFIDSLINKERNRGFNVSLRTLKPFDCEDYEKFVHIAKEKYGDVITTSLELISDYRIRIGCGSFSGSFMEYCAADISYPVRMKYSKGKSVLTLPSQEILDELCDISDNNTDDVVEEQDELLSKKVLPDRTKAARNRANKQLVDFITDRKVEKRLLAIISGHESSKWLQALQKPCRSVVEVYLEDEDQIDKVFRYLDKVCDNTPQINTCLENTQVDKIRLILDVLLPEAIIYAIAGVHKLSLEKAEEKYRKGPCFSNRERQAFDMMIEQQMKLKEVTQRSDSDDLSILNQN